MSTEDVTKAIADRLAVADAVVRYFQLVDAKAWDRFHEVFTDDTTVRWLDYVMEGRDKLVAALVAMVGGDEVVTHHTIGAMIPVVDGDTAEVEVRVRAMHYGVGPREGKFYESCGVQPTKLVRTPEGWRISHHEWRIIAKFGDHGELFAPEIAARAR